MVLKKSIIEYVVIRIIIINEVKKMSKISSVREKMLRQIWTFLKMSKNENPKYFALKSFKNLSS
jgi:aminopeptidase C